MVYVQPLLIALFAVILIERFTTTGFVDGHAENSSFFFSFLQHISSLFGGIHTGIWVKLHNVGNALHELFNLIFIIDKITSSGADVLEALFGKDAGCNFWCGN